MSNNIERRVEMVVSSIRIYPLIAADDDIIPEYGYGELQRCVMLRG